MAVFIFDIDGTLCLDSSVLAKEDLNVLNMLKTKGHSILFATGRGLEAVKDALHYSENLLNTFIACENGSKIFSKSVLISTSKFSEQEIKLILELIHTHKDKIECLDFWIHETLYTYKTHSFNIPIIEDKFRVNIDLMDAEKLIEKQ